MSAGQDAMDLDLRSYLLVLRRRRGVIAAAIIIVVAAALAASFLQTAVYKASADVLLQSKTTESLFDPQTGQRTDPARTVNTEIQVIKSQPVVSAVRGKLGSVPRVSVAGV